MPRGRNNRNHQKKTTTTTTTSYRTEHARPNQKDKKKTPQPHREPRGKEERKVAGRVIEESYKPAVEECKKLVAKALRRPGKFRDREFDLTSKFKATMGKVGDDPSTSLKEIRSYDYVDICDAKKKFGKTLKMFDDNWQDNGITQGNWGTCFLISSLCSLMRHPTLFKKLFVKWNIAKSIYGFVFFVDGEWKPVVVDGRVLVEKDGEIAFATSLCEREIWPSLLEKAFAKCMGCWANIDGGDERYCLSNLTGGISLPLHKVSFKELTDKLSCGLYLLTASLDQDKHEHIGEDEDGPFKLLTEHAYSIHTTAVLTTGERLIHLRDPWGYGDYNGPFSSSDKEHLLQLEEELETTYKEEDGNFWLPWDIFVDLFESNVEGVRVFPPGWAMDSINATSDHSCELGCFLDENDDPLPELPSDDQIGEIVEDAITHNGSAVIYPEKSKMMYFTLVEPQLSIEEEEFDDMWYSYKLLVVFKVSNPPKNLSKMSEKKLLEVIKPLVGKEGSYSYCFGDDMCLPVCCTTDDPENTAWVVVPCLDEDEVPYEIQFYYEEDKGEPTCMVDLSGWDSDEVDSDEEDEESDEETDSESSESDSGSEYEELPIRKRGRGDPRGGAKPRRKGHKRSNSKRICVRSDYHVFNDQHHFGLTTSQ